MPDNVYDDAASMLEINVVIKRIEELSGLDLSIKTTKEYYELYKLPKEGAQRTTTLEDLVDFDFASSDVIFVTDGLEPLIVYLLGMAEGMALMNDN